MSHIAINNDTEPIRLFKSNFLEFFTHISPITVLVIWIPVVLFFLLRSIIRVEKWFFVPLAFAVGLFIWTLAEYLLHRFLFHFAPHNPTQERISFLFHGVHHAQPKDKTRLVMPPVVSIPLALVFLGIFNLVFSILLPFNSSVGALFSGFISGYIIYDMMHYATHHFPMRVGIWKWLKRHHMQHHYKDPGSKFGVSSPLWDYVFSTISKGS